MRSHRARACAAAVVILVASSCGSSEADEATSALPPVISVIDIAADSDLARALDASAPKVDVRRAEGVVMPSIDGRMSVMSEAPVTDDEMSALMSALGLDPERVEVTADDAGRWGAPAGAADVDRLWVNTGFGTDWTMTRSESVLVESGAFPCPTVAVDSAGDSAGSGGCEGGREPVLGPPPTDIEVDDAARRLVRFLDVSDDDVVVRTDPVGPTTGVTITYAPAGVESDVRWNLTVAADGLVIDGNGPLRAPVVVADTPLVDLDEVMARLGRQIAQVPGQLAPLPTTTVSVTTMAPIVVDGNVVDTVRPPGEVPAPVEIPVIESARPALLTVWDVGNRIWLVSAVRLSGANGFSVVVAAASAETFRIVDRESTPSDPQVTAAPLTIPGPPATPPMPTVPPPTTTTTTTVPNDAIATSPDTAPAVPFTTTSLATTGSTLPRPTLPGPNVTLVDPDGTPITVPMPPDPNEVDPSSIPAFYAESMNAMLVGRSLADAADLLRRTGWEVRTDDLDDPTETFTADLRVGRVTITHRNGSVVSVGVF